MSQDHEWERFNALKIKIALKSGKKAESYTYDEGDKWFCRFYIDNKVIHDSKAHETQDAARKEINDLLERALEEKVKNDPTQAG